MIANRTQLLRHLRDRFLIDWHGHHGASHWVRVRRNGLLLAKGTGANALVVELFAFFHDSCRVNEYTDRNHGSRGAELAVKLWGKYFDATEAEMSPKSPNLSVLVSPRDCDCLIDSKWALVVHTSFIPYE